MIVGLGNPGSKYQRTRHNIGFMALEKLAETKGISFNKHKKINGLLAELGVAENKLRLLLPNTYMNESGQAIRATLDWFGLEVEQILVLVDDLDLPLGRLRLRAQGSAGGHNGLRSTIHHLNTQNFCRLRIGIGSPSPIPEERRARTIKHVLGNFDPKETS